MQAVALWAPFAAKADAILLHIGTNDLLQNNYPTAAVAAADMAGQLAELLAVIRAEAPRATAYVASIISLAPSERAKFMT